MTDLNICVLGDGFVKGLGDPSLKGWAGRLIQSANQDHGPITYYNLGVPGETSEQVHARLREVVPRLPQGEDNRLILCFGLEDTVSEDGKAKLSNQASVEALKQIILKTRSRYKLLMVGLPPVYDPQRNSRIKRLNGLYRELSVKTHVPFVDIYGPLSEDVQYKRGLVRSDKILPGEVGYDIVFDLISNDRSWWFS